jgi:hypothetical protein
MLFVVVVDVLHSDSQQEQQHTAQLTHNTKAKHESKN